MLHNVVASTCGGSFPIFRAEEDNMQAEEDNDNYEHHSYIVSNSETKKKHIVVD